MKSTTAFFSSLLFFLLSASFLYAQPSQCVDFSLLGQAGQTFNPDGTIYEDQDIKVTSLETSQLEIFQGELAIKSASVKIEANGPSGFFSQLLLDFSLLSNGLDVQANGGAPHPVSLNDTIPVQIGPGVTLQLLNGVTSNSIENFQLLLTGTVEEVIIAPQEFYLKSICYETLSIPPPNQCFELEDLNTGQQFGKTNGNSPGDVFYTEDNVYFSVEEFLYQNGNPGFLDLSVVSGAPLNLPTYFFAGNINLGIDFTDLPEPVTEVTFDFFFGGGEVNLGANGEVINLEIPQNGGPIQIGPNAFIEFDFLPINTLAGTAKVTGIIEELTVGGQELFFGNFCYSTQPLLFDFCLPFESLDKKHYELDNPYEPGDEVFSLLGVELQFTEPADDDEDSFIKVTDDFGGPFTLASGNYVYLHNGAQFDFDGFPFPIQKISFDYKAEENNTLSINGITLKLPDDLKNTSTSIGPYEFEGSYNANTMEGRVTIEGPELQNLYFAHAGILVDNVCASAIVTTGNSFACIDWEEIDEGTEFGDNAGDEPGDTINVEDLVVVTIDKFIKEDGNEIFGNGVIDDFPNVLLGFKNKAFFNFLNLNFDFSEYGSVFTVSFAFSQGAPGVNLAVNGDDPVWYEFLEDANGTIAPGVTFEYFPNLGLGVVQGEITSLSIGGIESAIDNICFDSGPCEISAIEISEFECLDQPGKYEFDLDIEYQQVFSQEFEVFIDGDLLGTFEADEFPLEDIYLESNAEEAVIKVCAAGSQDCCLEKVIDLTNCGDCEIKLEAELLPCNDGEFFVLLYVDAENASDSFFIKGNGQNYGTFAYDDSPITLGPFPGDGSTQYEFAAIDLDESDCIDEVVLGTVDCNSCGFEHLEVYDVECLNDSTFTFTIDFNPVNTLGVGFDLFIDGQFYAFFKYDDLPVTIDDFVTDEDEFTFKICDNDNPNCCSDEHTVHLPDDCEPECVIEYVGVEALPCTPNDVFFVELYVEGENLSDSFTVKGNGQNYGTFAYDDLPVTLGPFGPGVHLEFIVTDQDDPDCKHVAELEAVNCDCGFEDIHVFDIECVDEDTYKFSLDFHPVNPGGDKFDLYIDGNFFGSYKYADLPIEDIILFTPFDEFSFKICDQQTPDCCSDIHVVELPSCTGPCKIKEVVAEPQPCNNIGQYMVLLYVEAENTSDSFVVQGATGFYGTFAYDDLPIELGPFNPGTTQEFIVFDQNNPNCTNFTVLKNVSCDCEFDEVHVFDVECIGADSFLFSLDFIPVNTTNDLFDLYIDGDLYGTFPYDELPLEDKLLISDDDEFKLKICDKDNPGCCSGYLEFELPECFGPCELHVSEKNVVCTGAGFVNVVLEVEYAGDIDSVGVYYDGQLIQVLPTPPPSGQVSVTANQLPNEPLEFTVKGFFDGQVNCEDHLTITPDCDPECDIEVVDEFVACFGTNANVVLEIEYSGDIDTIQVFLDNQLLETYPANGAPITFVGTNLPINALEFSIVGLFEGHETCDLHYTVFPPCDEFVPEVLDRICNDDGTFDLVIGIDDTYLTSDTFEVFVDGEFFGAFGINDFPITLDSLSGFTAGDLIEVEICGLAENQCFTTLFEVPDCPTFNCNIENLEVEAFCEGGSTFIEFSFESENTSDSFSIISCMPLGTFAYGQGSYVVEVDPDSLMCANNNAVPFGIYDQGNPNSCNAVVLIEVPDCANQCSITELEAIPTDCEDGEFFFDITFEAENTSDNFLVFVNGVFSGFFEYDQLPVQVGPFEGDGQTSYEISVVDAQDPDCSADITADPVSCAQCAIENLVAEAFCEGGTYYVEFSFESENTSDSFIVQSCFPLATLAYGQSSYLLEIPEDEINCAGGQVFPFGVYDQNNPSTCWEVTLLTVPDCPPVCQFENVTAEATDCEDGEFFVNISFDPDLTDTLGFLIFANGELFGPFEYGQDFYTVGPFEGDGTTFWDFLLVDLNNPFCFGYVELGIVDCPDPDDCPLTSVAAQVECAGNTGLSTITLVLEHEGADADLTVRLEGDSITTISVGADPATDTIVLNPVLLLPGAKELTVCDDNRTDCCVDVQIGGPKCDLTDCLDFTPWQDSTFQSPEYEAGDLLFDAGGVEFYFAMENQSIFAEVLEAPSFLNSTGLEILTSSNLELHFGGLSNSITDLQFQFKGSSLRLKANDEPALLLDVSIIDQDTIIDLGDGVTAFISRYETIPSEAVVHLSGPLEKAEIGTPDGLFGDFCLELDDDVWPGDTDFNKIAEATDLLNIGLAFDEQGPARNSTSIAWDGMPADDWPASFADGTNYKHADCNGDGVVDELDVEAIQENYGLTHGIPQALPPHPGDPSDPPLFFDWPDWNTITPGQQVVIPLVLGEGANPVDDLYGLAFDLEIDTSRFSNFFFDFQPNWLADIPNEGLTLVETTGTTSISAAITRNDQQNASGEGTVGFFIGIIDDLAGMTMPPVEIDIATALDADEMIVPLYVPNTIVQFAPPSGPKQKAFVLTPNPSSGWFTVINESGQNAKYLSVFNAQGERIHYQQNPADQERVNGTRWYNGMYFIELYFDDGSRHVEPLVIIRP